MFNQQDNVTSLPIEHLHLNIKLRLVHQDWFYENPAGIRQFLSALKRLQTVQLASVMDPDFWLKAFFHGIANTESLRAIALRYFQSTLINFSIRRQLNITDVFPAYFAQSVRYLDLSRNDLETITGNFIVSFPQLKYLDVSYNRFVLVGKTIKGITVTSLLLFHPNIQVIVGGYQGSDDLKARKNLAHRTKRGLIQEIFRGDGLNPQKQSNCTRHFGLFISHTQYCEIINCVLAEDGDFVPCKYLHKLVFNFTNNFPIVVSTAPNLKQVKLGYSFHNPYPSNLLERRFSVQVKTHVLSIDISGNNGYIARYDYATPDMYGLDGVKEFIMTNIQLLNRPYFDITTLSMLPGLERLYLSSNSLFIPADFRLCHMFPNITVLDISNCKLQQLPQHFLNGCIHIRLLNVSANQMTSIPKHLRKALDNIQLFQDLSVDFSGNAYHCHCHKEYDDVISMIHWMRSTKVKLVNVDAYECTGHEHVELILEKDVDVYKDMCSVTEEIIQAVASTLGVCIAVALVTVCARVAYRLRYRLKTWYYRRQLARGRQNNGVTSEFDIYIGYDDSDKSFVIYELTHILENVYGFRCCIPDKDFDGEGVHTELISHFMSKCQMSIIVLSRQALQNPIHFMERNLARQMELHSFQMKKVIYIFIDDLSDVTDIGIQAIVSANVGLRYTDESVANNEAFYGRLSSKIYRTLFHRLQQQASWRNDKLRGGCM